ncbi:MAG: UDP-N-acetylmuramoyl-tripeptide--D-alanyl-D-alanine ligase [Opitutales bacterium]
MPEFQASDLARSTGGSWRAGIPPAIRGFSFDTRRIEPGQCFVALASESRDGHDFLPEAASKGASCALTDRVLDCGLPQLVVRDPLPAMGAIAADVRSKFPKPVIGITGSSGKTSTKEILRLLLGEATTLATAGNWNNRIGVPMTLFDLDPTRHEFAVVEAGINQPGEMALLGAMIRADLTIVTNIGPAHLERLGSLGGIAAEKSKLAESAKEDSPIILPAAVLSYPDFAAMGERCIALRFHDEAVPAAVGQVVDCKIESSDNGSRSKLILQGRSYTLRSASRGIARNAALAIVAARALGGGEAGALADRLQQWEPADTRGRVVSTGGRYDYIDCYNANPASMADALQAFQKTAPPGMDRCYVIGAMNELGRSAEEFHLSVGKSLHLRPGDRALFVGPEALTAAYRRGALSGGGLPEQIKCAGNTADIQSMVADFKGALFLKGSRSYHLEKLLPGSAAS